MEQNSIETLNLILEKINLLEEKIDKLSKDERKHKEHEESFSTFLKRWGGFYVASLLADETLKRK